MTLGGGLEPLGVIEGSRRVAEALWVAFWKNFQNFVLVEISTNFDFCGWKL